MYTIYVNKIDEIKKKKNNCGIFNPSEYTFHATEITRSVAIKNNLKDAPVFFFINYPTRKLFTSYPNIFII